MSATWRTGGALILCAALAGLARGADAKSTSLLSRQTVDDQLSESARQSINDGADIYNSGNHSGCVFFFRGALTALRSNLGHKTELQRQIDKGVADAMAQPRVTAQAFALREVLVDVRAGLVRDSRMPGIPTPGGTPDRTSLWDRMGGEANVTRIIDEVIDAAIADPKVNFFRDGRFKKTPAELVKLKRDFVCLASFISGGDLKYDGRRMKAIHPQQGMNITNDEFDAFVAHLTASLLRHGVKPRDVTTIQEMLEFIRKDIAPPPSVPVVRDVPKPSPPPPPTLWERLGGEKGVTKIIDEFIDAAIKDPKVNFFRDGKFKMTADEIAKMKRHFVCLASSIGEGPLKYEGRKMDVVHKDMNITDDEFDALTSHLSRTLLRNGVNTEDVTTIMLAVSTTRKAIVLVKGAGRNAPPPEAPAVRAKAVGDREILWAPDLIGGLFRTGKR